MLDCLTTIVDQLANSVGLPAMRNLTSLFSQIVLYKLRYGSNLYTEVVDRTKMRILCALEMRVEARKNYSRIVCS